MVTLAELCYFSGANGGETVADALRFLEMNATTFIPASEIGKSIGRLRAEAQEYSMTAKLKDVIRAEKERVKK